MTRTRFTRRLVVRVVLAVLALFLLIEAALWVRFYLDASAARDALVALKSELDLTSLENDTAEIAGIRSRLQDAQGELGRASAHVRRDPILKLGTLIPLIDTQAEGLRDLVLAGESATQTALIASDVLDAYARQEDDPDKGALEEAVGFIQDQRPAMSQVSDGLEEMKRLQAGLGQDLLGPLQSAADDLDFSIERLDGLVRGYEQADALLPATLGFDRPRRYLVLPQNDTELFPSGGLMSSYGIAVFDEGRIAHMEFEYFVNLFDRWQANSGGEYVEPPKPLQDYLLGDISWGLGEAGWYPDFPTTAGIATDFVYRGGAEPVDGVIALDLQFVEALLELLGPVTVREYGITVSSETISEVTLEQTRSESAVPGAPGKSFLSFLAAELIERLFATTKEDWVDLVRLLDRMAAERHLQLNFEDPALQAVSKEYGFDGGLVQPNGDFIHLADASVNSTKLNLILENEVAATIELHETGEARTQLTWRVHNPFPSWREGRDERLVEALMLQGVYGSYLRLYAKESAHLIDVSLNGETAGANQNNVELGRKAFGRFFPVRPGQTSVASFEYWTPDVVQQSSEHTYTYDLYVQKQPGTRAIPLRLDFVLPQGARVQSLLLDGVPVPPGSIETDLKTDRRIELTLEMD